jgi:hypothetical protein
VTVALRIDVDTFRGTRDGLPRLLSALQRRGVRATWFVTLGPDNMGRHVRRMLKPSFALKMLRSGAPNLYGWDIAFRGTLWPGTVISEHLADTLRLPDRAVMKWRCTRGITTAGKLGQSPFQTTPLTQNSPAPSPRSPRSTAAPRTHVPRPAGAATIAS